jgi:hypothetical protein
MTNDEFDFGVPPELCDECANLRKEIDGLHVLVDTLQANLRSMSIHVDDEDGVVCTPSYKWCVNWRPGDSL